jgi:hypothetical protein
MDNVYTSAPMGGAIVGFGVAQAADETANTSKRIRRANEVNQARGRARNTGLRRFGYTRDMEVIPEEASLIRGNRYAYP